MRIPRSEVMSGDILIFKRDPYYNPFKNFRGFCGWALAAGLSYLIKRFREPNWDRWGWHMGVVITPTEKQRQVLKVLGYNVPDAELLYLDAQFPRSKISPIPTDENLVHAYRVTGIIYSDVFNRYFNMHLGKLYDFLVYFPTALYGFKIPVWRVINNFFDCWEITWDWLICLGILPDESYPFITTFLHMEGEL